MRHCVSVIIPSYNAEKYIGKCLESALKQTYSNIEIVIADDCSTDGAIDVIKGYADKRIRLFENDRNGGPSYARNQAIMHARGDWVAVLDADDWWAFDRLEILIQKASEIGADMIMDDLFLVMDGEDDHIGTALKKRGVMLKNDVRITPEQFTEWDLGIAKPVVKKDFLLQTGVRYDETMRSGQEDFPFMLYCILAGAKSYLTPEAYYYYRIRPGSLTSRRIHLFTKVLEATDSLLADNKVHQNTKLNKALNRRRHHVKKIIAYNRLKEAISQKNLSGVAQQLTAMPSVFIFILERMVKKQQSRIYEMK